MNIKYKYHPFFYLILSFPTLMIPDAHSNDLKFYDRVKFATIETLQGNSIYANDKMQSKIIFKYELYENIQAEKITFIEYGTEKKLGSLDLKNPSSSVKKPSTDKSSWNLSTIDKGYDHNIGVSSYQNNTRELKEKNKSYRLLYISTLESNNHGTICFELTTKDASNQNEKTFSTCNDASIDKGTINIFARRTIQYTNRDFELTDIKEVINIKSTTSSDTSLSGRLYMLQPQKYITRDVIFKLESQEFVFNKQPRSNTNADSQKALMGFRLISENTPNYKTTYTETYLLSNKNTLIFAYTVPLHTVSTARRRTLTIPLKDYYESELLLLNMKYTKGDFMSGTNLCDMDYSTKTTYTCTTLTSTSNVAINKPEIDKNVIAKEQTIVKLIDNYGTTHPIRVSYNSDQLPTL